ncbi:hypothetical protein V8C86DRAFT_3111326 [Haematococcus lacustris]
MVKAAASTFSRDWFFEYNSKGKLLGLELLKEKHYRTQLLDELYQEVKQVTMKELRELAKSSMPSPAQPSPAQPSPAQPSPAQPSPAQPSPAQPSPAQPSPAQPSPAQPSPAQPSPAQPSPAQPSPAQPSPAQPSPAQPSPCMVLMIWNALVDHAEQWMEQAVLVSPKLALGVVAAFRRIRQKHYSPAFAAAFALDPANYKSAERNWSSWGNTYNAGRSQLNVATAEKMVYIKANIPSSEPSLAAALDS